MDKLRIVAVWMLLAIFLWAGITSTIYRFANPSKTQVQAFLHIPKSFICDFKE